MRALQAAELFANVSTCLEAIPAMILDDIMAITAQLRTYTDSGVHLTLLVIQLRVCFLRVLHYCYSCVLDRADDVNEIDYYALHYSIVCVSHTRRRCYHPNMTSRLSYNLKHY